MCPLVNLYSYANVLIVLFQRQNVKTPSILGTATIISIIVSLTCRCTKPNFDNSTQAKLFVLAAVFSIYYPAKQIANIIQ